MKRFIATITVFSVIAVTPLGSFVDAVAAQTRVEHVAPAGAEDAAPFNLMIIVLDSSISFRVPSKALGMKGKVLSLEALQIVQQLFRDTANQRQRRAVGRDMFYLVAADAASQVIWSGTREALGELTPDALKRKLALREQFAWCTDLDAAFDEAVGLMRKHTGASDVYVLTFSDLVNEPPRGNWRKCAPPSGEPPKGIDWSVLSRAHLGFYFVSKDFPHRPDVKWKAELERRELQADFLDAVQALTAGVTLAPPPPAVYRPTKEEVAVARGRAGSLTHTVIYAFALVAVAFIVSLVALFGWVWSRRRSGGSRRPA